MKRKFHEPTLAVSLFIILSFMTLMALGTWQIQRLGEKTEQLGKISARMAKPPVPLPQKILEAEGWEYRRVTMAGYFLHDKTFLLKPRTLNGVNGYHMLVPFQRASGGIVFVNRGWVSDEKMSEVSRSKKMVQLEGIVRFPKKFSFTPENNPEKKDWYWADVKAMADAAALKNIAPVFVTIAKTEKGVYPIGGKVEVNIKNDHKQYAFFWFTMGFILLVISFLSHWKPVVIVQSAGGKDETLQEA